jgi:glycerophosphoryl diester phosphodiesterase
MLSFVSARIALLVISVIVSSGQAPASGQVEGQAPRVLLTGYAAMAPDTFASGPPSGAWLRAGHEGVPQFPSQPVQGISSLWPAGDRGQAWWALIDNGFGAKINSADALLRIYTVRITWATSRAQGTGRVAVDPTFIQLADPDRRLPFPIVRADTASRWLTGADLDPESFVRMPDGSFWIGDEFGPFLVHLDARGKVLAPPLEVPGLRSPDHPHLQPADAGQTSAARVRRSRGFESLAAGPAFRTLYAALESAPTSDRARRIYAFDPAQRVFSDESWAAPMDGDALTELVGLEQIFGAECAGRFIGIERDGGQGADAKIKRVHELRLSGGTAVRSLIVDLLDVLNPDGLGGHPLRFTFPYITTEAVWPLDRSTLVLVNDNNFPGGGGRPGAPRDVTEFIRLRLPRPLCAA